MRPLSEKERIYQDKRNSVQRRLSPIIARGNFFCVPNELLFRKELGLEFSDFYFISYILSKKWDKDEPYFSIKKIARDLGESEATIHNSKNRLIKLGHLKIRPRTGENPQGKCRNCYDINPLIMKIDRLITQGRHKNFRDDKKNKKENLETNREMLKNKLVLNRK